MGIESGLFNEKTRTKTIYDTTRLFDDLGLIIRMAELGHYFKNCPDLADDAYRWASRITVHYSEVAGTTRENVRMIDVAHKLLPEFLEVLHFALDHIDKNAIKRLEDISYGLQVLPTIG